MRIVIVGAAGNVGSRTVDAALAAGHEVVAYVRRPEAVAARTGLTVAKGAAEDVTALTEAARDADAVVVSITGSMRDKGFMQRTLPPILEAARAAHVKRVVLVSVFGAGDSGDKASGLARMLYRTVLRGFLADKAAADRLLEDSGLDYTIVYPVNLKDAAEQAGESVVALDDVARVPGLPTLPFPNAARGLVTVVADETLSGRRVLLTTADGYVAA